MLGIKIVTEFIVRERGISSLFRVIVVWVQSLDSKPRVVSSTSPVEMDAIRSIRENIEYTSQIAHFLRFSLIHDALFFAQAEFLCIPSDIA